MQDGGHVRDLGEPGSLKVGDWVYERLREGIILGDFQPGERLRQSELAERFAVSQTPVREALGRLAGDGLVTLQPRRGAIVSELSRQEIEEIYELRSLVEPFVARRAAERAGLAEVKAVEAAAEASAERGASSTELFDRNRLFHLAIYEASGNRRMIQLSRWIWDSVSAIRMFDTYSADAKALDKMAEEHRAIAAAIAAGDGDEAARLVTAHMAAARDELLDLLPPDAEAEADES